LKKDICLPGQFFYKKSNTDDVKVKKELFRGEKASGVYVILLETGDSLCIGISISNGIITNSNGNYMVYLTYYARVTGWSARFAIENESSLIFKMDDLPKISDNQPVFS